ncbi:PDZ domain-containing protein [Planctomycetaceae bacterium SH139]
MYRLSPIILAACLLKLGLVAGCSGTQDQVGAADAPKSKQPASDAVKTQLPGVVRKASDQDTAGEIAPKPEPASAATATPMSETRVLSDYEFSSIGLGIYREHVPEGIKVTYVAPGSAAAAAGFSLGNVIASIDGKPLNTLPPAEVDQLLAGNLGQERSLETTNGESFDVTVASFEMKSLGGIRKFDEAAFATPSIEGLHDELKPVAQLIVERKYRAAERILETLAGPLATNGSFYLVRALNQAASHGMLTSDSRVADQASGTTLTAQIQEDIDLAVEMDESLNGVAAELLAWLSTRIVRDAANNQVDLTWVTPSDHLRWNMKTENRYRAIGDWIQLLNKSENLHSDAMPRYLDAIKMSRDQYLSNGDVRSAAFLDGFLAYRCCIADAVNRQMQLEEVLAVNRSALRLLTRYLREHPNSAMEVAAVFNAMCAENTPSVARPGEPDFDQFWELLNQTNVAAANFAIRYYLPHEPPQFNRLGSPMEAYLFHIESFLCENVDGLKASTEKETFDSLRDPQEFLNGLGENVFQQSMLPTLALSSGLVPEFVTNAATHAPFLATNEHGVDFYLITMKLYDVQFDRDVTMMVPMMAQSTFPPLKTMIEQLVPEKTREEALSRANESGRSEDLVIGVVYETSPGQHQVLRSPVINILNLEQ